MCKIKIVRYHHYLVAEDSALKDFKCTVDRILFEVMIEYAKKRGNIEG